MIKKANVINLFAVLLSICVLLSLNMSVCTGFDVDNQSEYQNYKIGNQHPNFLSPQVPNGDVTDNVRAQTQEDVVYWDSVQLTTDGGNFYPKIHDNKIVWQHYDGNDFEIFFYDGSTIVQLTDNDYDDSYPDIHNGMVTWVGFDGVDDEIFLYDGFIVHNISVNDFDDCSPQIHNGMVTWEGKDGNDYDIFLYDGSTIVQLSSNDYQDRSPQIHNGQVTWYSFDGNDYEIYLYDGIEPNPITNNDDDDKNPSIHNGKVVWIREGWYSYPPHEFHSEVYSYSEGSEKLVVFGHETVEFALPKIHNDVIVYETRAWWYGNYYEMYVGVDDDQYYRNAGEAIDVRDDWGLCVHNGIIAWVTRENGPLPMPYDSISITDYLGSSFSESEIYRGHVSTIDLHNGNVTWDSLGDIYFLSYDTTPPRLSNPDDVNYLAGSTGNFIKWKVTENNPDYYTIIRDGKVIRLDTVPSERFIEIDIDDLTPGIYTFECTVWDKLGYSSSDTVVVTVLSQAPIWVYDPYDVILTFGDPFSYQLVAIDSLGSDLGISEWWINDTTHFSLTAIYHEGASTAYITANEALLPGRYGIETIVTDLEGYTLNGKFNVIVVPPPLTQAVLKLSGNFDYLEKEEIHLQIAGLLTDSITGAVISGATVTFEIYNPEGILIIAGELVETTPGVYLYKADDTIKNLKDTLVKGIYWVFAHAATEDGREAVDMIQFHIDPPGGSSLSFFTPLSFLGIFSLGCVAIFYVKKWRLS